MSNTQPEEYGHTLSSPAGTSTSSRHHGSAATLVENINRGLEIISRRDLFRRLRQRKMSPSLDKMVMI